MERCSIIGGVEYSWRGEVNLEGWSIFWGWVLKLKMLLTLCALTPQDLWMVFCWGPCYFQSLIAIITNESVGSRGSRKSRRSRRSRRSGEFMWPRMSGEDRGPRRSRRSRRSKEVQEIKGVQVAQDVQGVQEVQKCQKVQEVQVVISSY